MTHSVPDTLPMVLRCGRPAAASVTYHDDYQARRTESQPGGYFRK